MIQAILEISGMLLIALAIGVYFTYRHWKAKYDIVESENGSLTEQLAQSQSKSKKLEDDLETLKANHQSELDTLNEQLNKQKEESTAEISGIREEHSIAIAELNKKAETDKKQIKKLKKQQEELEHSLVIKDEQLGEKERELAELSTHLHTHKVSYYKQIDGKRYKAATLKEADESVAGVGDGRISKADAENVFATISDGHTYTQVEKDTMHYIRENYKWTPEADELFRTKVRSWAAKGHHFE